MPGAPLNIPRTIVAVGVVSLLNDIAGDAITPLLPTFVASVGAGPEALGLIEGVADATASGLQLVSGYLTDRTGKLKGLTFSGYAIANLLRPLLSVAGAWWHILLIRFGDRFGKGIREAPRDALVADAAPEALRGASYGLHRGFDNAGAVAGPALAYVMISHGLSVREIFASTAVAGVLCLAVLGFCVKDVSRPPLIRPLKLGIPAVHGYRRFLLAILIFTLGNSSDAFLLWRARELGVAVAVVPLLWAVLQLAKSISSFGGGALSDHLGRRITILAGWGIYIVSYLGFAGASSSFQIWLLFPFYGMFYGLTEGVQSALVVDLVEQDWRGRALGAYNAVVGFAMLPASLIFGFLYQLAGPKAAFGTGAAFAVIASFVLVVR
jgi:MFS family permease